MTVFYMFALVTLYLAPLIFLIIVIFHDQLHRRIFLIFIGASVLFLAVAILNRWLFLSMPEDSDYISILSDTLLLFAASALLRLFTTYTFPQCFFTILLLQSYTTAMNVCNYLIFSTLGQRFIAAHAYFPPLILSLLTILIFPLLYLFFKKLLRPALDYTRQFRFWNYNWFIPLGNNMIFRFSLHPKHIHNPDHVPAIILISFTWFLSSFLSHAIILKMLIESSKTAELKEELHIFQTQLSAQLKQTQALKQRVDDDRRMRHDLRHYLLGLQSYISNQDYESANAHLAKYLDYLASPSAIIYCENVFLNSLVCYYAEKATHNGIDISISMNLDKDLLYPEAELSIIMGNLLENALEACMRQTQGRRFIKVKVQAVSPYILTFLVINSYEGNIVKRGDSFLSAKEPDRPGIGISSIRGIVAKYNGISRFTYDDQIFKVFLMLNQGITNDTLMD